MVETKPTEYWEDLSNKGRTEDDISFEVKALMEEFANADPSDLLNYDTEPYSISSEFIIKLDRSLDDIFSQHPNLNQKEASQKKAKFARQILSHLITIHIKKIACEITFEAYSLLKLFRSLDKVISEAQFIISPEGIFIEIMDPSRICSIRIILNDPSYRFYKKGKFALNIATLINVLSCESNDKSKTTLQFGKNNLFIAIKSEKFGSEINRTAEYLDLELEPIPLETLINIKYPIQFSLEQFRFIYTMKNLGVYSAIVDITANNNNDKKTVIFEESGETGSGEIIWEKKHLSNLQFFHELIKAE